jgi:hypothetical protein
MPHRSSIVVLLLLACTICANLVVYSWMRLSTPLGTGTVVYFALLEGQLSVICIWSAMRSRSGTIGWIAPVLAVIACSGAFALIDASNGAADILPYFGIHAAFLLIALWILRRTTYWQRRSGIGSEWRFSIAQLLLLMTVVAALASAMRFSNVFEGEWFLEFGLLCGAVALAVASVAIWSLNLHGLLRLAGTFGTALACGAPFYFSDQFLLMFALVAYLVQSIVLSAWLAWGGILPQSDVSIDVS